MAHKQREANFTEILNLLNEQYGGVINESRILRERSKALMSKSKINRSLLEDLIKDIVLIRHNSDVINK